MKNSESTESILRWAMLRNYRFELADFKQAWPHVIVTPDMWKAFGLSVGDATVAVTYLMTEICENNWDFYPKWDRTSQYPDSSLVLGFTNATDAVTCKLRLTDYLADFDKNSF